MIAVEWEDKVIRRMRLVKNTKWLNKGRGGKEYLNNGHSEVTRKKISNRAKEVQNRSEVKKRIRETLQPIHESEEYRNKMSHSQKESWSNQDIRDSRVMGIKKAWEDPLIREKRIISIQQAQRTETARKNKSKAIKKTWENASIKREASRTGISKRNKSDKSRQKTKETSLKNWSDEKFRLARSDEKKGGLVVFSTLTQSFIRVSCNEYQLHKNKYYYGTNSKYVKDIKTVDTL